MKQRKRGIVLIGILVLTLLATFFIGALMQMNPSRLRRTVQDEKHDNAAAAARAGVEYALARLAENQEWKAERNEITVDTDTMVVREDRGNVLGWIRSPQGEWAGFRLRFNYHDGPGGGDEMDDPVRFIPSPSISVNNLDGPSPIKIPLGTGDNYAYEGVDGFEVPENSVALMVEGMVGPEVVPDTLPAPPTGGNAQTTVRTLEGIYQITGFAQGMPDGAVLQAGGDSRFVLGNAGGDPSDFSGYLRLRALDQTAMMRTKGSSSIAQGAGKTSPFNFYPDMHSEVRVGYPGFSPNTKSGQDFTNGEEGPNDALMEIAWDKVSDSDQPDRLRLPAGVYTVAGGNIDTDDSSRVKYYPMTFAEYRSALVAGQTPVSQDVPEDFLSRVNMNAKTVTNPDGTTEERDVITFEKDVEVTEVDGNSDFAIVPAGGAKQKLVSDLTASVSPAVFSDLPVNTKETTGQAIVDYVLSKSGGNPVSMKIDGVSYSISLTGETSSGTQVALAEAVMNGTVIMGLPEGLAGATPYTGPVPAAPGTSGGSSVTQIDVGSSVTSGGLSTGSGYSTGVTTSTGGGGVTASTGGTTVTVTSGGGSSGTGRYQFVGTQINDPTEFLEAVQATTRDLPDGILETNVDPLDVPAQAMDDGTVPQDLEVTFAPSQGESAAIRTEGSVLIGSHVSGEGGAIVSGGRIDLIGLGVDLRAGQGERDGVSLYAKGDINISTYDQKRNKYWDASIKGVVFSKGDLSVRLGESAGTGEEPTWGKFDFLGSAIVLGSAPSYEVLPNRGTTTAGHQTPIFEIPNPPHSPGAPTFEHGNASMIAQGIRLIYEPKFLAPYIGEGPKIPIFGSVSVVEK